MGTNYEMAPLENTITELNRNCNILNENLLVLNKNWKIFQKLQFMSFIGGVAVMLSHAVYLNFQVALNGFLFSSVSTHRYSNSCHLLVRLHCNIFLFHIPLTWECFRTPPPIHLNYLDLSKYFKYNINIFIAQF